MECDVNVTGDKIFGMSRPNDLENGIVQVAENGNGLHTSGVLLENGVLEDKNCMPVINSQVEKSRSEGYCSEDRIQSCAELLDEVCNKVQDFPENDSEFEGPAANCDVKSSTETVILKEDEVDICNDPSENKTINADFVSKTVATIPSSSLFSVELPKSNSNAEDKNKNDDCDVLFELEQVLSDIPESYCQSANKALDCGVSGLPSPWKHQVPPVNCTENSEEEVVLEVESPSNSNEVQKLRSEIESLKQQIDNINEKFEKARDEYYVQTSSLEKALTQERTNHQQDSDEATRTITQLKLDLTKKQQQLDAATKDRESMVIKYAVSEKAVINVKKDLEVAERRLKEANRARDLLAERLKTVQIEKEKAANQLETKGQELGSCNRENQRLKEDLRWTQNKLKAEVDGRKEAEHRATSLIRKVEEARLEAEKAHKDAETAIKSFQVSEENKAFTLDNKLREQQAQLILERHEKADNAETLKQLQTELESLRKKQTVLIAENNQLSVKVQTLEKERLDGDQLVSRLKQESDCHQQGVADLRAKLTGIESLRAQLQHCEEKLTASHNEMDRLRQTNLELQQDAAACREREAELLDFTQKLTEKNVRLQSEFSATEAKAQVLESEQAPLQRRLAEVEIRASTLARQLEEEKAQRSEENSLLAKHLAEKTHRLEQLQQELEDSQGEIEVVKRKQAATLRELNRELQQTRKKLESLESGNGGSSSGSTSLGQGSRASSTSSLNTLCETGPPPPLVSAFAPGQEPDKQMLMNRLVQVQRENARRAEKLDFLEEHVQTLVNELQKKSRIIQNYVMRTPAGALSSDTMDQSKAELAKRSGIMASMYGSKTDENMTLELSMEINRKLQAVLEDTLLKNITLKESMDTLGGEIARLSK